MNVSKELLWLIRKCDIQPLQFGIRKKYCEHLQYALKSEF